VAACAAGAAVAACAAGAPVATPNAVIAAMTAIAAHAASFRPRRLPRPVVKVG